MIKKILIADDSPVARRILKSCIPRAEDFDFFEVEDGVQGLETFKGIRPDVTFMDIDMPNMSGVECLKEIKKINPDAVVIMCSSETNQELLAETVSLGALTVVKKPPTRESIQQALTKAQESIK